MEKLVIEDRVLLTTIYSMNERKWGTNKRGKRTRMKKIKLDGRMDYSGNRNILWNAMGKRRMKRTLGKRRIRRSKGNIQGNDTEGKSQRNHDRTLE
ncbi:hypothetical protein V1477_000183 [Vespula maculifrons]|uniref:Uncharacterized protein n=1 Tax=Vespula maculifrons TaxID=7453 RepID=A0ABD2D0W3_VESMC